MLRFSRSDDASAEKTPRIVDGAGAKTWLAAMAQPGSVANLVEIAEVLNALGARGDKTGAPVLPVQRKFAIVERIRGVLAHVLVERTREDPFTVLPLPDAFSLRFWPAIDATAALRDVYAWLVSQLPAKNADVGSTLAPARLPAQLPDPASAAAASDTSVVAITQVDALQRALDINAQAMLAILRARWPVPASMWERHCTLGQLVRDLDCQDIEVADAQRASATRTCRAAFVLPILVALADPACRSGVEFDVIRMAAQRWSRKVGFRLERRSEADTVNAPIRPIANPGPSVTLGAFTLRFDTQSAIGSIDKRLEALAEGQMPREAGIGDSLRPQAARELLQSLRVRWGAVAPQDIAAPDRPWRNAANDTQVLAVIGMPDREAALRETDLGRTSQLGRDQNAYAYQRMRHGGITRPRAIVETDRLQDLLASAETWTLAAESSDAIRCVRKHARPHIGLNRLIGLKLGAHDQATPLLLGWVEAMQGTTSEDDDRRLRHTSAHSIRVRLAPGLPQFLRASIDETELDCAFLLTPGGGALCPRPSGATAFAPLDSGSGLQPTMMHKQDSDGWDAVRASPREYGLVLPHASFRPQRLVRAVRDGALAVLRLEELMMRGADFDLVRFTPL